MGSSWGVLTRVGGRTQGGALGLALGPWPEKPGCGSSGWTARLSWGWLAQYDIYNVGHIGQGWTCRGDSGHKQESQPHDCPVTLRRFRPRNSPRASALERSQRS